MPSVSETDKEMVAKIEGAVEPIAKIRSMIGRVIFGHLPDQDVFYTCDTRKVLGLALETI